MVELNKSNGSNKSKSNSWDDFVAQIAQSSHTKTSWHRIYDELSKEYFGEPGGSVKEIAGPSSTEYVILPPPQQVSEKDD